MPSSCAFRKRVSCLVKVHGLEVALALGREGAPAVESFSVVVQGLCLHGATSTCPGGGTGLPER